MIFINDRKLARRLHDNAVPSSQQFWYLLISLGILVLCQCSFVPRPTALAPWNLYNDILVLSFFLLTTSWCYCINKSGDNKDFIARYMALSVPIALQTFFILVTTIGFGVAFLLGLFLVFRGVPLPDADVIREPFALGLNILGESYVLWRLTSTFKVASGKTKKKAAPPKKF